MSVLTTSPAAYLPQCATICLMRRSPITAGLLRLRDSIERTGSCVFWGLESFPVVREGGRLQNYRGQPPLSDGAFKVLGALVTDGAKNLERFDAEHADELRVPDGQALMLMALTDLTLEELASKKQVLSFKQQRIMRGATFCRVKVKLPPCITVRGCLKRMFCCHAERSAAS